MLVLCPAEVSVLQVQTADVGGADGRSRFASLSELKTAAKPNRYRVWTARWGTSERVG